MRCGDCVKRCEMSLCSSTLKSGSKLLIPHKSLLLSSSSSYFSSSSLIWHSVHKQPVSALLTHSFCIINIPWLQFLDSLFFRQASRGLRPLFSFPLRFLALPFLSSFVPFLRLCAYFLLPSLWFFCLFPHSRLFLCGFVGQFMLSLYALCVHTHSHCMFELVAQLCVLFEFPEQFSLLVSA